MDDKVIHVQLAELHPFPGHPFQLRDDDAMRDTVDSIKEYGVLVPAIVRPREEGGYEIVSGHRRKYASELAGLETMPVIVRNLDRDAATIVMVDSNLQRENILPSERAAAYKMKLEAIKRQGARNDLTSGQVVPKSEENRAREIVAESVGESGRQVQRYIRLTEAVYEDGSTVSLVDNVIPSYTYNLDMIYEVDTENNFLSTDSETIIGYKLDEMLRLDC